MDRRRELVRIVSQIDGLLAEMEDVAADPRDDDLDKALDPLIDFQGWKRAVEWELRDDR